MFDDLFYSFVLIQTSSLNTMYVHFKFNVQNVYFQLLKQPLSKIKNIFTSITHHEITMKK